MTADAWIIGAIRTPIGTENGKLANYTAWELGRDVCVSLIEKLRLDPSNIGMTIFGNALYAGGNPARMSSLAANIPVSVPSMTIDTQCCSGMDAIIHAVKLVKSGAYDLIIAGGTESHSTAPIRMHRGKDGHPDVKYHQPPFAPWPDKDPNMIDAAAQLAQEFKITREEQEVYAIESHIKAINARDVLKAELTSYNFMAADSFTRNLNSKICTKLPVISGNNSYGITASTAAVKADGAAIVAVVSKTFLDQNPQYRQNMLRVVASASIGSDPSMPALAPIGAVNAVLAKSVISIGQIDIFEIMEAFSSQAIACIREFQIDKTRVNLGGGALARGHPIGASGAVNMVRLFYEMNANSSLKYGLATIAGAGGLGSAMILSQ